MTTQETVQAAEQESVHLPSAVQMDASTTPLPVFITFTGADDDTDPAGMVKLSDDYPIEWGLLFSPKRQGAGRYPKLSTIQWMASELPLIFSAHLCGGDARAVIEDGRSQHEQLLFKYFSRAQINTADPKVQPSLIGAWGNRLGLKPILQCRGGFPNVHAVDVLFDASGGRGVEPSDWPLPVAGKLNGYAGGLNPDNVAAHVQRIGAMFSEVYDTSYWIDMESGVRDERDRFSLDKCRAVCEAVYGPPASIATQPIENTRSSHG